MRRVLDGMRVLDFSFFIAGPYCAFLLGLMGAEVIRVEKPGGEDDRLLGPLTPEGHRLNLVHHLGCNKKGITLDLRKPKGQELLHELVKHADVVVESFGVKAKQMMGLSYAQLKEINPSLVLVAVSGFGTNGPHAERNCFDPTAQAMSGSMAYNGFPGNPPTRSAVPYVDYSTGVYAALGAMFALYERLRTGNGQLVDISLFDAAVSYTGMVAAELSVFGHARQQVGNHSYWLTADTFKAKDGWVFVSLLSDSTFKRFLRLAGKLDLMSDPRFASDYTRFENRDVVDPVVAAWVADRTVAEAIEALEKERIPCGPVSSVPEGLAHPQIAAREMLVDVDYPQFGHVKLPGVVTKLGLTPGAIDSRAPEAGEDNVEVYGSLLGLGEHELEALNKEGVV